MVLTNEDKLRAIKISQKLQDYFDNNPGSSALRSTDVFDILKKSGLVEWDRHQGVKFRNFLRKLNEQNALDLIPQCHCEKSSAYRSNWYFTSAPSKTIKNRNLIPLSETNKPAILDYDSIKDYVSKLPASKNRNYLQHQLAIRAKYPRAYEIWTKEEENLLIRVYKEESKLFKLSELFMRQPSAIQSLLELRRSR